MPSNPQGPRRLRFPFFTINLSKSNPQAAPPFSGRPRQQIFLPGLPGGRPCCWTMVSCPVRGAKQSVPRDKGGSNRSPAPCQHPFGFSRNFYRKPPHGPWNRGALARLPAGVVVRWEWHSGFQGTRLGLADHVIGPVLPPCCQFSGPMYVRLHDSIDLARDANKSGS